NTFRVIRDVLSDELGYSLDWRVIDAAHFVPQHRERILIVGFRTETHFRLDHLPLPEKRLRMESVLHPEDGSETPEAPYTGGSRATVNSKYVLTDKLWSYLQ